MRRMPGLGPGAAREDSRLPAILLAVLLLVAMLGGAVPANATDEASKPLTSRRLFDQSRPGVQLITAKLSAQLVVPEPEVTAANNRTMQTLVVDKIRRGKIPATQAAARSAVIDEFARDPFRWFTPSGRVHRESVKLTATGSGFSITPDGYIITNAHVVAPRQNDLKAWFIAEDIRNGRDDFIADVRQDGLTQSQATKLLDAIMRWATKSAKLANFKQKISVFASSGSGTSSSSKSRSARLIDAGAQFPGKDVAILKVNAGNMATVPLGDDTALSTGDRLFVLGFPGPATFNPVLSKASQREPTLTQGVLSAKKQAKDGSTVLQTDAGMTHGNSGGPVFDEQGNVVGVATFGSVDPDNGGQVAGLNFAVPASIVNELLGQAHVKATEGTAGSKYREALDAFDKHWYKRALPLLEQVKALDPGHPLVGKLIKDSRTAIEQGRDRTPLEVLGLPVVVFAGVAAAVLVGAGALVLVSRRRRRGRRERGPSHGPAVPGAGWGVQPGVWDAQRATAPAESVGSPEAIPPPSAYPAATPPLGPGTSGHAERNGGWWGDLGSQQPSAPAAPTAEEGDGKTWNGAEPSTPGAAEPGPASRADADQAPSAQPGWQREWGQAARRAGPVEPSDVGTAAQPAELRESGAQPHPRPARAQAAQSPRPCWNCGHHNQPTLRYCEQCWSVLSS